MEKVYDMHVHYLMSIPLEETIEIFKQEFLATGTEKYNFLSCCHHADHGTLEFAEVQNLKGLFLKKVFAPNGYAYAHLEHPLNVVECSNKELSQLYLKQAQEYYAAGYDGMKMLEGYPSNRKIMKRTLCDGVYDKYYSFLEENQIPVTMHVANPEENWDITKAGEYAIKMGRVYDKTYPTRLELLSEVENILKKHPKLKFSLAHFGFMSYDIEQAKRWLDYENTTFDLTPGGEQLLKMRENWSTWEKFFVEYQDRIIYGSDFYAFPKDENWSVNFQRRPKFIRQFFETDTDHDYGGRKFTGVKLDEKILEKIYFKNVKAFWGEPKKINLQYMQEKAEALLKVENHHDEYAKHDLEYILNAIK